MAKGFWVLDKNLGLQERGNPSTVSREAGYSLQSANVSERADSVISLRRGIAAISLTSSGLTGDVKWGGRHVTDAGVEELWAAANNAGTAALARRNAGTWATVTYSDTVVVADLLYHHAATLDGKFYLAYNSDVNRLHVWDAVSFRRVGITKPAALTVADTGAGAYAATARRYRTSQRIYDANLNILAESELSDAVAFTPSGAGTAARITKSATIDSATHWVVWGLISTLGDTYDLYEALAVIAIGTTTYDDSTNPASYVGDFPQELGVNIPPPAAKFIITDGARLIMANSWEATAAAGQTVPKQNRVWFSRVLGTSDQGDAESIPNSLTRDYHIDIGDAGPITGLAGPLYGDIYVFKQRSIWKMIPTGDVTTPYRAVIVSETVGALDQRLVVAISTTAVAFTDESTIYVVGANTEPIPISTAAIGATLSYSQLAAATSYLAYDLWARKLLLLTSTLGYRFDTVLERWDTLAYAAIGGTNRGVMVANAAGAQRLHLVGQTAAAAALIVETETTIQQDAGTAYTATVTKRFVPAPGHFGTLLAPTIWYRSPEDIGAATLTVTYTRHDGKELIGAFALTSTNSNATGSGMFEATAITLHGMAMADALIVDVKFTLSQAGGTGDQTPTVTVDLVTIPYEEAPVVSQ